MRTLCAVLLIVCFFSPVWAYSISGRVVGVTDGDTLTVLSPANQQYLVRLEGIDAPESSQAFGQRSKQNLSRLVFGKQVNLDCENKESYGRLICKVMLPDGEDVCLDQVRDGMAWHYKQYQSEEAPADRAAYAAAEDAARHAHLGLWSDAHPVMPQDYRHGTHSRLCFDSSDHRVDCGEPYQGPVRGNRRSLLYDRPDCPNYDDISPANRVEFPSVQAAEAAGYKAAHNCP